MPGWILKLYPEVRSVCTPLKLRSRVRNRSKLDASCICSSHRRCCPLQGRLSGWEKYPLECVRTRKFHRRGLQGVRQALLFTISISERFLPDDGAAALYLENVFRPRRLGGRGRM